MRTWTIHIMLAVIIAWLIAPPPHSAKSDQLSTRAKDSTTFCQRLYMAGPIENGIIEDRR